jgi:hypothetical protein
MQAQVNPQFNFSASARREREEDALAPSVAVRCGEAETAAIIDMLDTNRGARQAVEAWDGITQDHHQRTRRKYVGLLADLATRHLEPVLAGLQSPRPHTRIWIALAITEAPTAQAISAIRDALALETHAPTRLALEGALHACLLEAPAGYIYS